MKIGFEGTLREILDDMTQMMEALDMLADMNGMRALPVAPSQEAKPLPVPKVTVPKANVSVDKPVDKPVEKKARSEKQLANDEKMRVVALARIAAKRAAKATAVEKPVEKPVEKQVADAPEAPPFAEPEVDPAEIVRIRQKTIEELQAAYANGHQKEVFELLSRFGNGAKSFRELPPESFVPIRQAIDLGALE